MIHIKLEDDLGDVIRNYKRNLVLTNCQCVENEYRRIIEWHQDAFRDDMSLKIIETIDRAERIGIYGVRTPIGESCITCLSSGCKLALVLWYYREDKELALVTEFARAGENVWRFIVESFDVNIVMLRERFKILFPLKDKMTIDGRLYDEKLEKELYLKEREVKEEPYRITKQKEQEAYDKFIKDDENYCHRAFREELSLKNFIRLFDESLLDYEEVYPFLDYMVVNHLPTIKIGLGWRRVPIWLLLKKDTGYKLTSKCSCKHPVFLDPILFDTLACDTYKDSDPCFALVLSDEEFCRIDEYPQRAMFGAFIEREKKLITIYEASEAVKKFHELYLLTEEWDDVFECLR